MATAQEVKTAGEFADAIRSLGRSEKARLRQLATGLSYFGRMEAEDLLQEAITRGLAGARRWPSDISLVQFLAMTMRSILNGETRKVGRRPQLVDTEGFVDLEDTGTQSLGQRSDEILIANEEKQRLLSLFEGDDIAQLMVEGRYDGMKGEELREFVGLSPREYATTLRAIRRAMNRTYHEGNKHG